MKSRLDKVQQGKKNRRLGLDFERKVRENLESNGWVVSRWQNNVEFMCQHNKKCCAELRPARMGRFRTNQNGFPDFIAFNPSDSVNIQVIGVECKINGYLDKEEKEKCKWYLDNNIFGKIMIAKKNKIKNKMIVEYEEYKILGTGARIMKQDETLVMDGYKQLSKRIRKGKVVSGLFKCLTCGKTKLIYAEEWKNKK